MNGIRAPLRLGAPAVVEMVVMPDVSERIWSEPLTASELAIIARVTENGTSEERRLWLNHVRVVAEHLAAENERLRSGLGAAITGLELAAGVHEAIVMDTDEDEAIKHRAVETMRLGLGHARQMLASE